MVRRSAVTLAMWLLCAASAAIAQPAPSGPKAVIAGPRLEVSQPISFETGKPALTAGSHAVLDAVAATMLAGRTQVRIQIGVHTDSLGADAANLRLSQERADAIHAYLVGRGVPASRLEAKGFGETVPIASNATAAGRAQNRRVELLVVSGAAASPAVVAKAPAPPATSPAPPAKGPPVPPAPSAQVQQEARELFTKGERAYNAGDFEQAVQFFIGSYARVTAPQLLYNIAQCYRLLGERKLAIAYYEQYLATAPGGGVADRIRQQIAELRKAP